MIEKFVDLQVMTRLELCFQTHADYLSFFSFVGLAKINDVKPSVFHFKLFEMIYHRHKKKYF